MDRDDHRVRRMSGQARLISAVGDTGEVLFAKGESIRRVKRMLAPPPPARHLQLTRGLHLAWMNSASRSARQPGHRGPAREHSPACAHRRRGDTAARRAHDRRDRHRQGYRGAAPAPRRPAGPRTVRRRQPRGDPGDPARVRAVRLRARRVHRGAPVEARPVPDRAPRGDLLSRDHLAERASQAKLLKILEKRAVRRLGATRSEPVDAWIISATNADLATELRERRFRQDVYHRLSVVTLALLPSGARRRHHHPRRALPRASLRRVRPAGARAGARRAAAPPRRLVAGQCPRSRQCDGARGAHGGFGHRGSGASSWRAL